MFIVDYTLYGTTLRQTWTVDFYESVLDEIMRGYEAAIEIVAYVEG